MGLFGAKDMSGYWSAGRGAICCAWLSHWLSDWLPERIFVPPTSSFKIDHLSILLRRMNIMMRRLRISYSEIDHWLIFHVIARPRSDFIYTKNSAWPRGDGGAMRQKMAIFKGSSLWGVYNLNFLKFLWGRSDRKLQFSNGWSGFATQQKCFKNF